jgi:hypothetical protein
MTEPSGDYKLRFQSSGGLVLRTVRDGGENVRIFSTEEPVVYLFTAPVSTENDYVNHNVWYRG